MPRVKTVKDADTSRAAIDSAETPAADSDKAAPKKRAIRMGPDEFVEFINAYQNADKSEVYVYRLWPAINRKPAYIQKLPALEFSADWLLRNWGSGDYNIVLTDSSVYGSPKVGETFIKFPFDVDQWPMVDYEELLIDHPGNKDFVKQARMRGFLPSSSAAGPTDPVTLLQNQISEQRREMAELRKRASESSGPEAQAVSGAIAMLQQTATQSNAMLMEQVKALTSSQGAAGIEKLLVPMMNMQAQSHQATMNMLITLIANQQTAAPAKSSMAELKELLAFLREVRDSEPERDTRELTTLERLAPALLAALPTLFGSSQAASQAAAPQPASQAAAPQPASQAAAPQPASQAAAPQPASQAAAEVGQGESMIAVLRALGAQLVRALERDLNGLEFAQSVEVTYGPEAYEQLRELGAEQLKGLLMGHAETWASVRPLVSSPDGSLGRLDAFLAEFVSYGDEGGEGGAL